MDQQLKNSQSGAAGGGPGDSKSNNPSSSYKDSSSIVDAELKQKIFNHEISKIKKMKISDIIAQRREEPNPNLIRPISTDYISISRGINEQLGIQQGYVGEKTPGQMLSNYLIQGNRIKQFNDREMNRNKVLNFAKRGKLGVDFYLIIFAALGSLMIPYYFFKKLKKQQKMIVEGRGIDPNIIKYLDQNSSINIDEVSLNTVHYKNQQREQQVRIQLQNLKKIQELQKQISEM